MVVCCLRYRLDLTWRGRGVKQCVVRSHTTPPHKPHSSQAAAGSGHSAHPTGMCRSPRTHNAHPLRYARHGTMGLGSARDSQSIVVHAHAHNGSLCTARGIPRKFRARSRCVGRDCALATSIARCVGRDRAVLGEIALWPRASRDTTGVLSSIVMAVGVAIETWPSAVAGVLPGGRPSPLPRLSTQASRRAHRRFGCRWR